jgi:hypothetical protein
VSRENRGDSLCWFILVWSIGWAGIGLVVVISVFISSSIGNI